MNLDELTVLVSRKRGDLEEWKATANGTTTSLVCANLCVGGDNEYAGDEVLFPDRFNYDGSNFPVARVISSDIASHTLTLAPALDTPIIAGERFEKRRRHLYIDVLAAISAAMTEMAGRVLIEPQPDTSLVLVSGQYEYTIPVSGSYPLVWLYKVEVETDPGNYEEVAPLQWGMRAGRGLWIAEGICENYSGHTIRLSGYAPHPDPTFRGQVSFMYPPYILAYCDWYLAGQRSETPPQLLDMLYRTKEFERVRAITQLKPNTRMAMQ